MEKRFFASIITTFLFVAVSSCDKDKDENSIQTPFSGELSGVIAGELANWDFVIMSFDGGDFKDNVETTPIIDGKFSFSSLPTPKQEELKSFINSEIPIDMIDVQISDKSAKVCQMSLLAIKGDTGASYEERSIVQGVYSYTYPNTFFVDIVMYYYADKDLKIKGSWSGTNMGVNFSSEVEINLKRGWNTLHLTQSGTEENSITNLKNGVPTSGTAWTGVIFQ